MSLLRKGSQRIHLAEKWFTEKNNELKNAEVVSQELHNKENA